MVVSWTVLTVFGDQNKIDQIVPPYPSKEELIFFRGEFQYISILKIKVNGDRKYFISDKILKGKIDDEQFQEYAPQVNPIADNKSLFIFFFGKNPNDADNFFSKLLVINEDKIENIDGRNVLFKGYTRQEIINLLSRIPGKIEMKPRANK